MNAEQAAKLRAPFPRSDIDILPKPYKKDSAKGNCRECGGYHGLPAVHLDYVGHAALTNRLLDVDPDWTWEPVADPTSLGLPTGPGGMWIRLTIAGVTRLGYGDADGKSGGNAVKETIGDALRNAGMRFGIALDLWRKHDRQASTTQADTSADRGQPQEDPWAAADVSMAQEAEAYAVLVDQAKDTETLTSLWEEANSKGLTKVNLGPGRGSADLQAYIGAAHGRIAKETQ